MILNYFRKRKAQKEAKRIEEEKQKRFEEYKNERKAWAKKNNKRIFFSKTLITQPDKKQVIYIPGNRVEDEACNTYIKDNLQTIKYELWRNGYNLFYAPEYFSMTNDMLRYHIPDADEATIDNLAQILSEKDADILNYAENANDFPVRKSAFIRYIGEEKLDTETSYAFSYFEFEPTPKPEDISFEQVFELYLIFIYNIGPLYSLVKPEGDDIADWEYEFHTNDIMQEIRDKVNALRNQGISEAIIQSLFEPTIKLSRLIVTKKHSILLPDYNNMEIKLEPLNKAVFLLFLRHKEGILFKHLRDYRDELIEIYEKITYCKCDSKQIASIEKICDPTQNAINEKCARIREAFISKFDERLAKNYIITGERGKEKSITLPRDLVEW